MATLDKSSLSYPPSRSNPNRVTLFGDSPPPHPIFLPLGFFPPSVALITLVFERALPGECLLLKAQEPCWVREWEIL